MKGWILYKCTEKELTPLDHGVNRLLATAKKMNIDLEVYKPSQFELIIHPDNSHRIWLNGGFKELPDFVLPRLGAETPYLGLAVIRQFEHLGIPVYNSSLSIENVRDKLLFSQILTQHQLPTPKTMLFNYPQSLAVIESEIGFPLIIKTIIGAKGNGVFLCESTEYFKDFLELINPNGAQQQQLILQEFIASSHGHDLRVFVVDGEIVGCMQRIAKEGFKANFSLGGAVAPYPLNEEIRDLAIKCAKLVDLKIAGIDLLFAEKGFTICEGNSSPGFKGLEQALKIDVAQAILDFVVRRDG